MERKERREIGGTKGQDGERERMCGSGEKETYDQAIIEEGAERKTVR